MESDNLPWLFRVVNPGVPWWVALPCNVTGGAAIVIALVNPDRYAWLAIGIALAAGVVLYGTAFVRWMRRK